MLRKHTANAITLSRIVLLPFLPLAYGDAGLFCTLYLICGATDMVDGWIARKTGTHSQLGAKLDSAADLILFAAVLVWCWLRLGPDVLPFLPWIILTIAVRGLNLIIAAWKYRTFAILHTWGNKLTGGLLFVAPFMIAWGRLGWLWPACILSVLSAAEELVLLLRSRSLDINERGLLFKGPTRVEP
ncbi:MAG: CDP-alcohol phosphatidyltransferase [Paenibacillaceae bacterium]|nr:CDP-alcohol phosphatidyltransferase [Paenibacillaceae bacterium]